MLHEHELQRDSANLILTPLARKYSRLHPVCTAHNLSSPVFSKIVTISFALHILVWKLESLFAHFLIYLSFGTGLEIDVLQKLSAGLKRVDGGLGSVVYEVRRRQMMVQTPLNLVAAKGV